METETVHHAMNSSFSGTHRDDDDDHNERRGSESLCRLKRNVWREKVLCFGEKGEGVGVAVREGGMGGLGWGLGRGAGLGKGGDLQVWV